MAFKTSDSNLKQSAQKNAATVVAAEIGAGFFENSEAVDERLNALSTEFFADLKETADAEAEAKSAPAEDVPLGEDKFTWGKKQGQSIAQVYTDDQSYIDWLVNKDTNQARNWMRDRAKKYIDSLKAGV